MEIIEKRLEERSEPERIAVVNGFAAVNQPATAARLAEIKTGYAAAPAEKHTSPNPVFGSTAAHPTTETAGGVAAPPLKTEGVVSAAARVQQNGTGTNGSL